ncbi:MAG: hypothetical protein ABSG56_08805 [Bryobacteraceae bacterium]
MVSYRPGAHAISALGLLGIVPAAIGVAAILWCQWDFTTFGRNPMYVGSS